jgi:chondroitin AC lyase
MTAKNEWVQIPGASILSGRDANPGEKTSAVVYCRSTGLLLEEISYINSSEKEKGPYSWPKYFSDEINKKSQFIRAGEKNNAGGFDTVWSFYRNKLWKESGADIEAFTTSPHLDNWMDGGAVSAPSALSEGFKIGIKVRHSTQNVVYEELEFPVPPEISAMHAWPYHLCSFINSQSNYLKAGEKDEDSQCITPIYSSCRNHLWCPEKAPLIVEVGFVAPESLRKDVSDSFEKILSSIVVAPPAQSIVDNWIKGLHQGKFDDIVYPPQNAEENTGPLYEHISRVSKILNFARKDAVQYERYYRLAAEAITFYTERDFGTKNWWDRQVGLAKAVAECLVLLAEHSPAAELIASVEYLKSTTNTSMGKTGANQADFTYVQLYWAVAGWKISSNGLYITHAYAASEAMSRLCLPVSRHGPEEGEGISIDYSFSQHTPEKGKYSQLYAATYGFVYLNNIFKFVKLLSGGLSLKADSLRHIEQFIIEGMGWFCYAGVYDFHVCGRSVSRGMEGNKSLAAWSRVLLTKSPLNPDALNEVIRRSSGDESDNNYYKGGRAYWVNDYLCHFHKSFSFWNKTVSTRTVGSETGNGENIKGYYIGCGSYFISRTGREYFDIQPLWDWQRLPGTTVEQVPDFKYPLMEWGVDSWGSHDHAGAMGDGRVGISSMILSRNNVKNAKKTAIALEDSVVFMGGSIDTMGASHPVLTSVNQSLRNGEILIIYTDGSEERLGTGRRSSSDIAEVVHDGFRYDFRRGGTQVVTVDAAVCSGSWKAINKNGSDAVIQGEVFSLWIEHAKSQSEGYMYKVYPAGTESIYKGEIINGSSLQGLLGLGKEFFAGALYDPMVSFIKLKHVSLKLLTPVACIARSTDDIAFELTLSDLTQQLEEVEIVVDWGHTQYSRKLPLPKDDFRGQSVKFVLTPDNF